MKVLGSPSLLSSSFDMECHLARAFCTSFSWELQRFGCGNSHFHFLSLPLYSLLFMCGFLCVCVCVCCILAGLTRWLDFRSIKKPPKLYYLFKEVVNFATLPEAAAKNTNTFIGEKEACSNYSRWIWSVEDLVPCKMSRLLLLHASLPSITSVCVWSVVTKCAHCMSSSSHLGVFFGIFRLESMHTMYFYIQSKKVLLYHMFSSARCE